MESRIKRDGFDFGSFSGEAMGEHNTLIITPENFDKAVAYIDQQGTEYVLIDGAENKSCRNLMCQLLACAKVSGVFLSVDSSLASNS